MITIMFLVIIPLGEIKIVKSTQEANWVFLVTVSDVLNLVSYNSILKFSSTKT